MAAAVVGVLVVVAAVAVVAVIAAADAVEAHESFDLKLELVAFEQPMVHQEPTRHP